LYNTIFSNIPFIAPSTNFSTSNSPIYFPWSKVNTSEILSVPLDTAILSLGLYMSTSCPEITIKDIIAIAEIIIISEAVITSDHIFL
jgi:hypothetical protein